MQATACLRVTITNRGGVTGGGSFVVYGETHRTTYPGDTSAAGHRFLVTRLAPGASITRTAVWLRAPRDSYRGTCDPGLRS